MRCPDCKKPSTGKTCPNCGASLSVDDATLDTLLAGAGVPNLASLMKRAKEDGLIQPVLQYGPTEVKP